VGNKDIAASLKNAVNVPAAEMYREVPEVSKFLASCTYILVWGLRLQMEKCSSCMLFWCSSIQVLCMLTTLRSRSTLHLSLNTRWVMSQQLAILCLKLSSWPIACGDWTSVQTVSNRSEVYMLVFVSCTAVKP